MSQTLTLPTQGTSIQEVDGVKYLVSRLEENRTCDWYITELQQGRPVVVPQSKRGHMIGLLKAKKIPTKSQTVVVGKWVSFILCEERKFRD